MKNAGQEEKETIAAATKECKKCKTPKYIKNGRYNCACRPEEIHLN
jgi:uncharacterized Zn finger protein (UPF0148 family)